MKVKLWSILMLCFIYICDMVSCGCCFITSMMTSQFPKDEDVAPEPVPNLTISMKYNCSQCSFKCDDKSSATNHMLMHRSSPFKIKITSYGSNGYISSQTRYEGDTGYLVANMQTSPLDPNVQGHEIVIQSGFSGERMSSDVQCTSNASPIQHTTLSCQTTPSDSRPRTSILKSMLTDSHSDNSSSIYAGTVSETTNKGEMSSSSSSGVVETGTFGSCTMPQMQQGGFVCEECNIHFDKQETFQFHKNSSCALSRKRLFTETSVATCMAQEPAISESYPLFSETVPSPMTSIFMPDLSASGGIINATPGSGIVSSYQLPQDVYTCTTCNITFFQYETYVGHIVMCCELNRSRLTQTEPASSLSQMQSATECESNQIKTYSCILCEYKGTKLQMRLHAGSHKFEGDRAVEAYLLTFVVEEQASLTTRQPCWVRDWRELTSSLSNEDLYLYISHVGTRRNHQPTDHQIPPHGQPSTSRSEASGE